MALKLTNHCTHSHTRKGEASRTFRSPELIFRSHESPHFCQNFTPSLCAGIPWHIPYTSFTAGNSQAPLYSSSQRTSHHRFSIKHSTMYTGCEALVVTRWFHVARNQCEVVYTAHLPPTRFTNTVCSSDAYEDMEAPSVMMHTCT